MATFTSTIELWYIHFPSKICILILYFASKSPVLKCVLHCLVKAITLPVSSPSLQAATMRSFWMLIRKILALDYPVPHQVLSMEHSLQPLRHYCMMTVSVASC